MALSKKLKEQAKALNIPYYWNYGEKKLRELIKANKPKPAAKKSAAKPKVTAKPKSAVKFKVAVPAKKPAVVDNKKEILKHLTICQHLITAERKKLIGGKAQYHSMMLDRAASGLKEVGMYLGKIQ